MANIIENQPIMFSLESDCWLEDSGMKVLAEYGDITQFQMELEPCGADVNLIQGGDFNNASQWVASGGWSVASGSACHVVGVSGALTQSAPVSDGVLVRLTITVDSDTSGGGVTIFWGNIILNLGNGTHEEWFVADSCSTISITTNGSTAVCVSNLQALTINTDFQVNIKDEQGVTVDTLETSDGYFDFSDGYFTCSIDWETLAIPEGCYYLEVVDPCPCSQRGIVALDLTSGTFEWSLSASWTIGGGSADFSGSSTGVALLANTICSGTTYEVTYTVTGLTGNVTAQIGFGSTYGTARTSDGTYTEQIVSNGTGFRLRGTPTGAASFSFEDVSIVAVDNIEVITSNTIKVSEAFNCTTLALRLCNDSDGLGFGFANTGFSPLMRIPASLNRSNYPMERLGYDNSLGRKYTYYGRRRKALELGFDGKEFMHDFASLFGLADHFYIDDVEYYVEDDEYPTISWSDGDDIGGVTINVSKKTQLVENRRLNSASVGCEVGGSVLLDKEGLPIYDQNQDRIKTP